MNKFKELVLKLREILQIDRPELDFGIYRIINARAVEIEKFLTETLSEKVQVALSSGNSGDLAVKEQELQKLTANLEDAGVNLDSSPKYMMLCAEVEQLQAGGVDYEGRVYAHLLNFFSRYYDKGDFISKRRYKGDAYAVPYSGEEVLLYWANFDQYYTKSGENFANYTIKLDDTRKVHFRLVAADTAKDNRKDNDLERCFVLAQARDIVRSDENGVERVVPVNRGTRPGELDDLVIQFDYLPMPKGTKQSDLVLTAVKQVLSTPDVLTSWPELAASLPTEKNKARTRLEKELSDYVSKNKADYFIHKDLGTFLRRELDFYIKNEMLHLDDIQHIHAFREIEKNLKMIQCMRAIADELITFMAQLEDFQKKLWLKKKFVTQCDYCITLDRVPTKFYELILGNQAQIAEWEKLGFLCPQNIQQDTKNGEREMDLFSDNAENEDSMLSVLRVLWTKKKLPGIASPYLMVDTQFFDADFKARLLAEIDDLDAQCDGLLIHSENFQALNLLQERYREQVKCIYIDPPYNTGSDGFIYRDNYQHSSWLSMMYDRLICMGVLFDKNARFFCSIDDNENSNIAHLFKNFFGEKNFLGTITWEKRTKSQNTETAKYMLQSKTEYILPFAFNGERQEFNLEVSGEKEYNLEDEKGVYRLQEIEQMSAEDIRSRKTMIFPIFDILPRMGKQWKLGIDTKKELVEENRIIIQNGKPYIIYRPEHENPNKFRPFWSHFFDKELYGTSESGLLLLDKSLGFGKGFNTVKPISLITKLLYHDTSLDALILDYFGGSGTTAHAVINLNREDGGKRKYILVEMGDHFNNVLKPRIQKVVFSEKWKDGKPVVSPQKTQNNTKIRKDTEDFKDNNNSLFSADSENASLSSPFVSSVDQNHFSGISHCFKYMRLESYEDTLNNLALSRNDAQQDLLNLDDKLKTEYLLNYMLDVESRGSLLSTDNFRNPFDYMLNIAVDSAGAMQSTHIDLVETFNYLIGLRIKHQQYWPERGICIIDGTLPNGENTLILWRDCEKVGYEALTKFCESMGINPRESIYDCVYVNGDNAIPNQTQSLETEGGITKVLKLRQIEEEFLTRMWDDR